MIDVNQVLERQPDRLWGVFPGRRFSWCASPSTARRLHEFRIEGVARYALAFIAAIGLQRHPIDRVLTMSRDIRYSRILFETEVVHHIVSAKEFRYAEWGQSL